MLSRTAADFKNIGSRPARVIKRMTRIARCADGASVQAGRASCAVKTIGT